MMGWLRTAPRRPRLGMYGMAGRRQRRQGDGYGKAEGYTLGTAVKLVAAPMEV